MGLDQFFFGVSDTSIDNYINHGVVRFDEHTPQEVINKFCEITFDELIYLRKAWCINELVEKHGYIHNLDYAVITPEDMAEIYTVCSDIMVATGGETDIDKIPNNVFEYVDGFFDETEVNLYQIKRYCEQFEELVKSGTLCLVDGKWKSMYYKLIYHIWY